jgi:hypothetical protein
VPMAMVPMVYEFFLSSFLGGHLGVFKTINKVRARFIWKGMDNDIHVRGYRLVTHVHLVNQRGYPS